MLDERIQNARIRLGDRKSDAAFVARWDSVCQLTPGVAPVGAAVDSAARPATVEPPRTAKPLVRRRIKDSGILRVHDQVDGAGEFVHIKHTFPGAATVPCSVYAPLLIPAPEIPECRHVSDVGVPGVDHDLTDVTRFDQP